MTSAYFEEEITFVPEEEDIDDFKCTKIEISFQNELVKSKTNGKQYDEWTIGCRPEQRYASFQSEYFLSRVYNSDDQVFVYRRGQGSEYVVEALFGGVRFKI